jgi:hypothetical protein
MRRCLLIFDPFQRRSLVVLHVPILEGYFTFRQVQLFFGAAAAVAFASVAFGAWTISEPSGLSPLDPGMDVLCEGTGEGTTDMDLYIEATGTRTNHAWGDCTAMGAAWDGQVGPPTEGFGETTSGTVKVWKKGVNYGVVEPLVTKENLEFRRPEA